MAYCPDFMNCITCKRSALFGTTYDMFGNQGLWHLAVSSFQFDRPSDLRWIGAKQAAIYGALAGDLAEVLPACRQWEDTVWALFRCWLEVAVDSFLNEV
jgi:hypothetical protein